MTDRELCSLLASGLGALYTCKQVGVRQRVRTPFLYPDGDNIDVFCREHDGVFIISDLGETTRWLSMQTTVPRRTKKQLALLDDICLNHGVVRDGGVLMARAMSEADIPATVMKVAQAALRASDLWFTFRTRSVQSTTEEVADFLSDLEVSFYRGQAQRGRSGQAWTVDFHVRTATRNSMVFVLSTGSRSAAKTQVKHVFTGLYDLSHLSAESGVQFVSLFDDTADVWSDEDFTIIEDFSKVAVWSNPDEFAGLLSAA